MGYAGMCTSKGLYYEEIAIHTAAYTLIVPYHPTLALYMCVHLGA